MLRYIVRRIAVMIPTLLIIIGAGLHHHRAAAGRLFRELCRRAAGAGREGRHPSRIELLRKEYGFDQPPVDALLLLGRRHAARRFRLFLRISAAGQRRRRRPAVADRCWCPSSPSSSPGSIAFPIGIYSATHQYSWGDYGLTFLGLLGLAIPNFMLALILMYFANIWFGTSIGGI